LHLNPSTFEVTYAGHFLRLTPKEYSILELLMRHGRRVISRSVIIEHIWSLEEPPTEETVKAHIKSLRHKLKSAGAPKQLIETVHGIGYRLGMPRQTALAEGLYGRISEMDGHLGEPSWPL
jgi:DNA-binding response OmpR family regulator